MGSLLAARFTDSDVESLIIGLLVVCLIAAVVYFGARAARRPDLGGIGAAIVLIVGAILILLSVL
jgi:hypothetical protein